MAVLRTAALKLGFTWCCGSVFWCFFSNIRTNWGKKLEQGVDFLKAGGSNFWIVWLA